MGFFKKGDDAGRVSKRKTEAKITLHTITAYPKKTVFSGETIQSTQNGEPLFSSEIITSVRYAERKG